LTGVLGGGCTVTIRRIPSYTMRPGASAEGIRGFRATASRMEHGHAARHRLTCETRECSARRGQLGRGQTLDLAQQQLASELGYGGLISPSDFGAIVRLRFGVGGP